MAWNEIQRIESDKIIEARIQLHWALQIVASVGHTFLAPLPDDSTPNTAWRQDHRALCGHWVTSGRGRFSAALEFDRLTLMLLDPDGVFDRFPLSGRTLAQGLEWFGDRLGRPIERTAYELPAHPVDGGEVFSLEDPEALSAIADRFANADLILMDLAKRHGEIDEVRCWPHHFDIATLVKVPTARSEYPLIGVGMTPGDDTYPEPYWSVSPWSHAKDARPAFDPPGVWRTEGWFGAALTEAEILDAPGGQRDRIDDFIDRAVEVSRHLVETAP